MDSEDKATNIKFFQKKLGDFTYNINRGKNEDINLITSFEDMYPKYDEENGIYLELNTEENSQRSLEGKKKNIIKLGKNIIKDKNELNKKQEFIHEFLINRTYAKGYEVPSVVQMLTIPDLILKKDALIQFKSGTGKTHAFLMGCLWNFDNDDKSLQYIFMTSSHEVATQIYDQVKFILNVNTALCIGRKKDTQSGGGFKTNNAIRNKSIREEIQDLEKAQIIVCTIGKFYDFLINKKDIISMNRLKAICIDEFDNIIASNNKIKSSSMSTEEQMNSIMQKVPEDAQRIFFSATVTPDALEIAYNYFRKYSIEVGEPLIIVLDIDDYTLKGIKQYYILCRSYDDKKEALLDILKQCRISQCIIFTNRISSAEELKYIFDQEKFPLSSEVFHGGLSADTRDKIFKDFKDNTIRILISTDLTSRGLDIQSINLVINFDMPDVLETYIHRVGRSGRYGRKGIAINFVLQSEKVNELKKITSINECSNGNEMVALPSNIENLFN